MYICYNIYRSVVPKKAGDIFHIEPGDQLLILGDIDQGLAIVPEKAMQELMRAVTDNVFTKKGEW